MKIDTTPITAKPSPFTKALANFTEARDTLDKTPINGAQETALMDALGVAERKLMQTPAVTLSDIRAKAEIIWQDPAATPNDDMLALFFADLRRLTDNEPSRTFEPASWLAWFERNCGGYAHTGDDIVLLWPEAADVTDNLAGVRWQLETRGAHEAVRQEIRAKIDTREATTQLSFADHMKAYETAKAKLAEHRPEDCPEFGKHEAWEARTATLADETLSAIDALIKFPSPDAEALALKMQIYAAEDVNENWNANALAQIIAADAARLAVRKGV